MNKRKLARECADLDLVLCEWMSTRLLWLADNVTYAPMSYNQNLETWRADLREAGEALAYYADTERHGVKSQDGILRAFTWVGEHIGDLCQ